MAALRQSAKDPATMLNIERDADVSDANDSDIGENFVKAMRKRMAENLEADD